jgi:hypothetical protein
LTATIDWVLIEQHWQELMQVALSIQLTRSLRRCCCAGLGPNAARTGFTWPRTSLVMSFAQCSCSSGSAATNCGRRSPRNTNKIESYNGFSKWLSFGGDVIAENEPEEQQQRLRYNDLIASVVIPQNKVDMMQALREMAQNGEKVHAEDIEFLSPYPTHNIRRFGHYKPHLDRRPEAWIRDPLFGHAPPCIRVPSMTAHPTITTTHFGDVNTAALERLESSYDTTSLRAAVDSVDRIRSELHDPEELRDDLLEIHRVAHPLLNGVPPLPPRRAGALPERVVDALDLIDEFVMAICSIT